MSDSAQHAMSTQEREARLRTGMRWLVWGSLVALMALFAWAILSASSGSTAGMVAASSGTIAVAAAWSFGYIAIKARLAQIEAPTEEPQQSES